MQGEEQSPDGQAQQYPQTHHEQRWVPPVVDFKELAEAAIADGLFETDQDIVDVNRQRERKASKLSTSLLDRPYPNGPMVIERWEEDVSEASMDSVRRNVTEANKLLLPKDKVLHYFHHRFVAHDVFASPSLTRIATGFRLPSFIDPKDSSISFDTETKERKTVNRRLFTREEILAGLQLVQDDPEVVLSIMAYQSVIQDFLGELRMQFEASMIGKKAMEDFDAYVSQWGTVNFTNVLIPAIAIFLKLKRDQSPDIPPDQAIDADIFHKATEFIISNGAFRNWVNVPQHVAVDGKGRTNHFLCPAVGTIREQLMDGSVLGMIYGLAKRDASTGDPAVTDKLEQLSTLARENLARGGV